MFALGMRGRTAIGGVLLGALLISAGAAADAAVPSIHIDSHRVKVHSNGMARFRLTCNAPEEPCEGFLWLRGRNRHETTNKAVSYGRTKYKIAAGAHGIVSMFLSETIRDRLTEKGGKVELVASVAGSSGPAVTSTVTIIQA
jgi:hypothetical protein